MKAIRLVALVAILAMAFYGAANTARAQDKKVIKIATQSPLSGDQANVGVGIKNGAEIAIELLSEPLSKLGYTVQIAPFDDQANPETGVANAQNIINDPAILGVVGHYNSGVAIPSSEVYNTVDLVMVSPANTNPKVTDRNLPTVNRVCGRDDIQGAKIGGVFLDFAKDKLGVKSVYIVYAKTAYGQGVAEFFKQATEARGLKLLGFEGVSDKETNFDTTLIPISGQSPDLIYWGGEIQGATFLKQLRDKGIKSVFIGPDGLDDSAFAKITGETGVGAYFTTTAGPAENFPKAKDFVAAYTKKYGNPPPPYAAQAYDAAHIVLMALEKVAKDSGKMPARKDVAAAVRATKDFEGLTSTITFDVKGDPLKAAYFLVKVTSADPAAWGKNEIIQTFQIDAPPLPSPATPAK